VKEHHTQSGSERETIQASGPDQPRRWLQSWGKSGCSSQQRYLHRWSAPRARRLHNALLELYSNYINPGSLWGAAHVAKKQA